MGCRPTLNYDLRSALDFEIDQFLYPGLEARLPAMSVIRGVDRTKSKVAM